MKIHEGDRSTERRSRRPGNMKIENVMLRSQTGKRCCRSVVKMHCCLGCTIRQTCSSYLNSTNCSFGIFMTIFSITWPLQLMLNYNSQRSDNNMLPWKHT